MFNRVQRYSIRKLTIGAASVLIGIAFVGIDATSVHADTTPTSEVQNNKQDSSKAKSPALAGQAKADTDAADANKSVQPSKDVTANQKSSDSKSVSGNALKSEIKNNNQGTSKASAPVSAGQKNADETSKNASNSEQKTPAKDAEQNKAADNNAQNKANDNKDNNELVINKSGKDQTDAKAKSDLENALKEQKSVGDDSQTAVTVTLSGKGNRRYNGKPISDADVRQHNINPKYNYSNIALTVTVPGQANPVNIALKPDYFDWYEKEGNDTNIKLSGAPKDSGDYTLKLNSAGKQAVDKQLGSSVHIDWTKFNDNDNSASYHINLLTNQHFKVSGYAELPWKGTAYTDKDLKLLLGTYDFTQNVKITLWDGTQVTLPTNEKGYANPNIRLIPGETVKDISDNYKAGFNNAIVSWINHLDPNVMYRIPLSTLMRMSIPLHVVKAKATIGQNVNKTKIYDGQPASLDISQLQPKVSTDNLQTLVIRGLSVSADDLQFVDKNDSSKVYSFNAGPKNVGTYYIKLTNAAIARIKAIPNPDPTHYKIDYSKLGTFGTYTIKQAPVTVNVSGSYKKDSDDQADAIDTSQAKFTPATTLPNGETLTIPSGNNALTADDFDWYQGSSKLDNAPTAVGSYQITLNQSGIDKFKAANPNYDLTFKGGMTYLIQQRANVSVTGEQTVPWTGKPAVLDPNKFSPMSMDVNFNPYPIKIPALTAEDFEFVDEDKNTYPGNQGPSEVNDPDADITYYYVHLSAKGRAKLEKANPTYHLAFDWSGGNDWGTYTIVKSKVKAEISATTNTDYKTYDGTPAPLSLEKFKPTITADNGLPFNLPNGFKFKASDLEFVDSAGNTYSYNNGPIQAGVYTVRLTTEAADKILTDTTHYEWQTSEDGSITGTNVGTYTIYKASEKFTFTGSGSKTYNGQPASVSTDTLKDAVKAQLLHGDQLDVSGLTDADFDWYDGSTKLDSVPTDVGNYIIKLNDAGLKTLNDQNKNYTLTLDPDPDKKYTYTINKAPANTASVVLSGKGQRAYNGSQVSDADIQKHDDNNTITLSVTLSGQTNPPTINLKADDFDWNNLSTLPTNAGKYTLTLNDKGKNAIKEQLNKNFDIDWSKSSIGGQATYTINKATASAALAGNGQRTYNGSQVSDADIQKQDTNNNIKVTISIPNSDNKITYTLQDGDYTWNTKDGSAPSDVGTYTIKLNNANILRHLKDQIAADSTWNGNVDLTDDGLSGSATFKINQATATVSFQGQHTKTYNGHAAQITDAATAITAGLQNGESLDLTGLTNADFDWYDGTTKLANAPKDVGNYTVKLNDAGITALKSKNKNYDLTLGTTNSYTYKINQATGTATLSGTVQKNYDGQPISDLSPIKVSVSYPNTDGQTTYALQDGDYEFINTITGAKSTTAPVDVGTYSIELTDQGRANIKKLGNPQDHKNVDWTIFGTGTYTINQATATVSFQGQHTKTYNGHAAQITDAATAITAGLQNGESLDLTGLTNADFDWYDGTTKLTSAPIKAGTYTIKLNDDGLTALKNKNKNYALTLNPDKKYNAYTYKINKAKVTVNISGSDEKNYDGKAGTIDPSKASFAPAATLPNGETLIIPSGSSALTTDDFQWASGTAPISAGSYKIILKQSGKDKFNAANPNYDITFDKSITYTINKAAAHINFQGSGSKTYDGNRATLPDDAKTASDITATGLKHGDSLDLSGLTDADFDWYDASGKLDNAPKDAGNYTIKLNAQGLAKLQANQNYTWGAVTGSYTYKINKATASAALAGSGQRTYNGNPVTNDDIHNSTITLSVTIPGQNNPAKVTLTVDDFDWNGKAAVQSDADTYTLTLNATGKQAITDQLGTNANIDWTHVDFTHIGSATYTITKANSSVTLSNVNGGQSVDYKDAGYGNSDIILGDYTITLEHGLTYTLQKGDLEFVPSENPLNAGTYQVQLSAQGRDHISAVQSKNYTYNFDHTGTGTFTIKKVTPTVQLHGTGSKVYDGQGPQASDFGNTTVGLTITAPGSPKIDLVDGDYEFVGQDRKIYTSPVNVGTYTIELTDQGKNKISHSDINAANLDWGKVDLTNIGAGSFTITAAKAKAALSGKNNRDYNGSAVTINDINNNTHGGDIIVTISIPNVHKTISYTLQDKDYNWDEGAAPIKAGKHTLSLNKNNILTHLQDKINADAALKGNIDLTADDLSGSATFTINKVKSTVSLDGNSSVTYNGKQVTTPIDDLKRHINEDTSVNNEKLDLSGLNVNSFDWYDSTTGKKLLAAPLDAGTYTIKLNDTGLATLTQHNTNYALTLSTTDNSYTFKINKATGTVVLNGNHTEVYTGKASANPTTGFSLTLGVQNKDDYSYQPSYTLKDGDLEYLVDSHWVTTTPIKVGTYQVELSDQGWQNLQQFNGSNISWTSTSFQVASNSGNYTITVASASAKLSGSNSRNYTGIAVTTTDINAGSSTIKVVLTFPGATESNKYFTLSDGQYTWQTPDSSAPKDAGDYTLKLNDAGLTALQDYIDSFIGQGNVKLDAKKVTGSATFTINKVAITVNQKGSSSRTYTGRPAVMPTTDLTKNISANSGLIPGENLDLNGLGGSDFDWYNADGTEKLKTAPTDAGSYIIKISNDGLHKLQNNNKNYSFTEVGGSYSYTIKQGQASAVLNGQGQKTYDGSAVTDADIQKQDADNNITLKITIPGQAGSQTITLSVNDFNWTGQTTVPSDADTYTLTLNANGQKAIKDKFGTNQNIDWKQIKTTGTAKFTIKPLTIAVKQKGSGYKIYDGNPASVSINDLGHSISSQNTINGHDLVTSGLTAADFDWFDNNGTKLTTAPTDVGDYTIKLNSNGLKHLQDNNQNYSFTKVDGSYVYTIKQADATATIKGSGSHEYNGQAAQLTEGSYSVDLGHGLSYALQDGDYTWANGSAPINVGNYKIVLTKQGKNHIKAVSGNYNWKFDSQATFDVSAQEMGLVVDGNASKDYDGEIAQITADDLTGKNGVHIKWGNNDNKPTDINFTLSPDDFVVVDEHGNSVSKANVKNSVVGERYYIRLTQTALDKIQKQNKNYKFILDQANNKAFFYIYARKAALTLTGNQTTTYGTYLKFVPKAYTLDFSNWIGNGKPNIILDSGDISIQDYPDSEPTNAGTYKVIINKSLIDRLQSKYTNYDFYPADHGKDVDNKHQPATYIIQPMQIGVKIKGEQKVQYGSTNYNDRSIINNDGQYSLTFDVANRDESTFKGFTLKAGDLEFVTKPGNVGTYQVRLTKQGIDDLKAIHGINPANYDWDVLASDLPTANFEVTQKPIIIKQSNHDGKVYNGTAGSVTPDELINGLNSQGLISGQTLNTNGLTLNDFTWSDPDHINVGTYHISLTADGLKKLQDDNPNYSFGKDDVGSFIYTITQAKAAATLSGHGQSTYTGYAVTDSDVQKQDANNNITISITIPGQSTPQTITLLAKDFNWNNQSTLPISANTDTLTLNANGLKAIKDKFGTNQNIDWDNTTITNNATYTIKAATGTATLSGSVEQNYNGQAISDLSPIKVTVSYPNTDNQTTYTLVSGDYEFVNTITGATSKTAPSDAGTYTIQLTDQGKTNIKKLGNPNGQKNVDWTISGTGTYTIHQVAATITLDRSQKETYDGHAKPLKLSDFVPKIKSGNLKMPTIPAGTFDRTDYDVVDNNGQILSDNQLINAGTYKVELNANGIAKLKALTGASNFTWPATVDTTGKLIIYQATATAKLNGENSRVYNGQSVTTDDLNNGGSIAVTITVNNQTITYNLQNGDYSWNTPDGLAPTNASSTAYQITLNKDAILAHLQDKIDHTNSALKGNYKLTADDLSGTAKFTITQKALNLTQGGSADKPYDGKAGSVTLEQLINGLINGESFNTDGLSLADFDWSNTSHTAVGTYHITLNDAGLNKLKAANPNYSFNIKGSFTYTINKAQASAVLNGNGQSTYNGLQVTDDDIRSSSITLTVTIPGQTNPSTITPLNLVANDFDWDGKGELPTKAGTYTLTLNATGKKVISDQLGGNTNIDWNKTTVTGKATYTINKATGTIILNGSDGKTFDDKETTKVNNGMFTITINGTQHTLTDDQYQIVNAQGNVVQPKDVGTYYVVLTPDAVNKLEQDTNYAWTITPNGTMNNELGTYKISPAQVNISISGSGTKPYDGKTASATQDKKVKVELSSPSLNGIKYNWQDGDFVWYSGTTQINAPIDVGSYRIGLDASQLQSFLNGKFGTGNVEVNGVDGQADFTITKATPKVTFHGEGSKMYDGQPITNYTTPIGLNITDDSNAGSNPISLIAGIDYVWKKDGQTYTTAPVNVGNYTIDLTDAGKVKIHNATANGDNLDWSKVDLTHVGTGTYTINKATAKATLSGSGQSIYTGSAVTNADIRNSNITLSVTIPGQTNPAKVTLTVDDFDWNNSGTVPADAGTYTLTLNNNGKKAISDQLGSNNNIDWSNTTISGKATYKINQATAHVSFQGNGSKPYDGTAASIPANAKTDSDITVSGLKHGDSLDLTGLTDADFDWYQGSTKLDNAPKDAGTYTIKLNAHGLAKLQANQNYTWGEVTGTYTYVINAATATAGLSGENSKTDDGQPVTTAEINHDGTIIVTITTNSDLKITYKLQDGDYSWNTGAAPSKVGTYTITLSAAAKTRLQAQIDHKYGKGNVILDQLCGKASFEIKAKSVQPTNPTQSTNNTVPTEPSYPVGPETQPSKPTVPLKPVLPNIPPIKPVKPLKPIKPQGKPATDLRKKEPLFKKDLMENNRPKKQAAIKRPAASKAIRRERQATVAPLSASAASAEAIRASQKAQAEQAASAASKVKCENAKTLPQTGEKQSGSFLAALGLAISSLAGLFGIATKRKKKDE